MIETVLRHLGGIENYGVISLCLFFACFLGAVGWALLLKRPFLNAMAALPLERDPLDSTSEPPTNHD